MPAKTRALLSSTDPMSPRLLEAPFDISPEACLLMEECELHPYKTYLDLVPPANLKAWRLRRINRWRTGRSEKFHMIREHGTPTGAAAWVALTWDSGHFGFGMARLELLVARGKYLESRRRQRQLLATVIEDCQSQNIKHLTARTDASDLVAMHTLEEFGFELIDGIQTFGVRMTEANTLSGGRSPSIEVGLFETWQLEGVLKIAGSSYRFDRFHSDPALDADVADRLHQEWVANACAGAAADAVFVASENGQVLGFVTVKLDPEIICVNGSRLATIVLVATGKESRGRGIAKLATLAAVNWLRNNNASAVQVGTQLRNIPAGRLYEQCGFRLIGASLTFRKVLY
jgi:GNAT superfamily N-acetyltransferase/N-acetylglutamate synthase-like GNAT family acetyltransferase